MSAYTDADVQAAVRAITVARGLDPEFRNSFRDAHQGDWSRAALDAVAPAIAARALREAADKWAQGQWADAPRRADRVEERIANAQHVADWLRSRAEQVERTP